MKKLYVFAFLSLLAQAVQANDPSSLDFSSDATRKRIEGFLETPQSYYFDKKMMLTGGNRGKDCDFSKVVSASLSGKAATLEAAIQNANFNPCCIPKPVRKLIESKRGKKGQIVGISFGMSAAVTVGLVDAEYGREALAIFNDDDSIQFSVVSSFGVARDVALPMGTAVSINLLQGQCYDVHHYLGHFVTGAVGPVSKSYGLTSLLPGAKRTYCDALSIGAGTSTPLIEGQISHYKLASPIYQLTGARARQMIRYFKTGSPALTCK